MDMSKFPVEPQLARMLLKSADEGCVQEAVIIAAMLSTEVELWTSLDCHTTCTRFNRCSK